ncbi:MAG: T9SS type A sorting domain-containing protein, partial [Bacteroidota bacterium]
VVAAQLGGTSITAVDQELSSRIFETAIPDGEITSLAAGDLDGDGSKEFLVGSGNKLFAFNRAGSVADGYPVKLFGQNHFVGSPLVADVDGDGRVDVVSLTSDGTLVAFDEAGRMKNGFPLQAISSGEGSAALFQTAENKVGVVAVSKGGEMSAWELNASYDPSSVQWGQHLRDALHTNSEQSSLSSPVPKSTEFFPRSLVYNWPNPVYGSTTQIRYFVSEDASVTVNIFDLAGLKITQLQAHAVGGIDNELTWDVSGINSGVYLAHVEVNSGSKTESAVIKIAVVK